MTKIWINGTLIASALLCAVGTGYWFGHDTRSGSPAPAGHGTDETAAPVATVQTQGVRVGTIARSVDAYGTIQAAAGSAINVSVPFDARVERVLVAPGARVEADTPLVEVGPTPEAQLQLKQAQEAVAAAERSLEAVRKRLDEQLATNAEVATAEQAQQTAKTQLDSLNARGIQDSRRLSGGAAGIVTLVNAQAGQVAVAGTALVSIIPQQNVEAVLGVEPGDAARLKVGDRVDLQNVHALDEATDVIGTIRLVAQQVNPQTRLTDVAVTMPPGARLLPGTFVIGRPTVAVGSGLIVPRSAVLPAEQEEVLFVVHDGKAQRRVVSIGLKNGAEVQVTGATLHEGEQVVVAGNTELEDGMPVKVEPLSAATAEEK